MQEIAENIFNLCFKCKIDLQPRWTPREENKVADTLSKIYDYDDWSVKECVFQDISARWGPFTVDRFASAENAKLTRFNSKFYSPGTEQVDALSISWSKENNYLVPPVYLVPKVIQHLRISRATGVLFVPQWPSAAFWPLIINEFGYFRDFVRDYRIYDNQANKCVFSKNWRRMGAILFEGNKFLALKLTFET